MNQTSINLDLNNIDQINKIIDMERYNGRVNLFEAPSQDAQFKMQERLAVKNKTTEYREALDGIWESNLLSQAYFSAANIQILQNGLRAGVYKKSENRFFIGPQNIDTLKIIMRSIYLQYAEHRETDISGQITRLNQLVLDYAIPTVYNEAVGYVRYCQDQSSLVVPLEVPRHHDREYKQLELKPWV